MHFQIDDRVVHPGYGVGRIVGLVTKHLLETGALLYYEVALGRHTMWVPVDAAPASRLRPLTPKGELGHYRGVLRGRPVPMTPDHRQRQQELSGRLKVGSLQDLCEIVRDLTGRGWSKTLGEGDSAALRLARDGLCQEWAAVDGVSVQQAATEVDALLLEAQQAYRS